MTQEAPRKPGRPRSEEARRNILEAAFDILMNDGFGRLTVEAVAAQSGVGKPTIYRNWSNAPELAMAALMQAQPPATEAVGRTLEASLKSQLIALVQAFSSARGKQITFTLAAADPESELTRAFRNQVILASREQGRRIIEESLDADRALENAEMETILDMIYGPIFYRLLVGHQTLSAEFATGLARLAARALS